MENIYDDNDKVKDFYEGFDNIPFFDYDFYEKSSKHRNKEEIRKWINKIGVSERLHIDKTCQRFNDEWFYLYFNKIVKWYNNPFPNDAKNDDLFVLSPYQFNFIVNSHNSPHMVSKPQEIIDYNILYLEQIIWTKDKSHFIWECLAKENLEIIETLTLIYRIKSGKTDNKIITDSSLIHNLQVLKWICRSDSSFCCPSEILPEDFHHLGYQENKKLEEILDLGVVAEQKLAQDNEQKEAHDSAIKDVLFHMFKNNFRGDLNAFKAWNNKYEYSATNFSIIGTEIAERDDDIFYEKSNVRKTIHYIGVKLYGQFLSDFLHVTFLNSEDGDSFDFNINGKFVFISTVANQNNAAIYLTSEQYKYMTDNHLANYHVVRISLKDLGIKIDRIRDTYGSDADIVQNEYLKSECDKLVSDYWSSADVNTFKRLCQEYSISIHKEEYK